MVSHPAQWVDDMADAGVDRWGNDSCSMTFQGVHMTEPNLRCWGFCFVASCSAVRCGAVRILVPKEHICPYGGAR